MRRIEILSRRISSAINTSRNRSIQSNFHITQISFVTRFLVCFASIRFVDRRTKRLPYSRTNKPRRIVNFQADLAYIAHATTRHRVVLIRAPSHVTAEVRVHTRFVLLPFYIYIRCAYTTAITLLKLDGGCAETRFPRGNASRPVDFLSKLNMNVFH